VGREGSLRTAQSRSRTSQGGKSGSHPASLAARQAHHAGPCGDRPTAQGTQPKVAKTAAARGGEADGEVGTRGDALGVCARQCEGRRGEEATVLQRLTHEGNGEVKGTHEAAAAATGIGPRARSGAGGVKGGVGDVGVGGGCGG